MSSDASIVTSRSCGACRACCTTLAVRDPALDKRPHTRCEHECENGCAIYAARPKVCASFACAWLVADLWHLPVDAFPESERPDQLGVIVHQLERDGTAWEALTIAQRLGYNFIANASEIWAGALDSPGAGQLLRRMEDAGVFVLRRYADCETKVMLRCGARGVPYVTQERDKPLVRTSV